ncbi:MAG TPA: hypothetical protein VMF60_09635 [Acidimicrobiales bacterium]|nr:hypothetical protein [Acidimicrobiales bacterium]
MARKDSGRWVARAAATGGSRSYRGQMPLKWYGSLFLIVLLGVAFIVYSRYERLHPSAGTPPTVGSHWYAALAVDVCGNVQPDLASNPTGTSTPGLHTDGDGVIRIEPTKAADAGNNATLARFVEDYPKFGLTSTSLTVPGQKARKNGQKCPKQTPDAGRPGTVQIKVWPSSTAPGVNHPTTTTDPASVKMADGQLITIAFVPTGAAIPKPNATAITTMLEAISTSGSTTTIPATSVPAATTTTAPGATATSVPGATATTAPGATNTTTATTTKPTTTTTKPGGQPSP